MPLSLEELVATAVENQHVILEFELKKGIPLNYLDEKGQSCVTQMVIRKPSRCLRAQKFTCQTIPYNSQKNHPSQTDTIFRRARFP